MGPDIFHALDFLASILEVDDGSVASSDGRGPDDLLDEDVNVVTEHNDTVSHIDKHGGEEAGYEPLGRERK